MKKSLTFIMVLVLAGMPVFSGGRSQSSTASGWTSGDGPFSYPVRGGGKVTYWQQVQAVWSANYTNLGQTPFAQRLMEKTGIEIEYLHPSSTAPAEAFNLMVADGNLPDIIQWNFHRSFSGGPARALDEGIIIPLNDVIPRWAPNLRAYLDEHPNIDKDVKTDSGQYYTFPFVRGHERLQFSSGLMVRKDWLDDLGLSLPTTLDEVYEVLTAFKEKKGAAAPYTAAGGGIYIFGYPYGFETDFFVHDDGRMRHGVLEPGFRSYIETMAKWYREDLLDRDIFTMTAQTVTAKITTGVSGMTSGSVNSGLVTYNNTARRTDPNFTLVMMPSLTLRKGDRPDFSNGDLPFGTNTISMTGISTKSRNVELAARLLDYGYTPEGHMLYNFGTEGISYTMVNGFPTFTDFIINNPQGMAISNTLAGYALSGSGGPFIQDVRYLDQYMNSPEGKEGLDVIYAPWVLRHKVPIISLTTAENSELVRIMSDVNTYVDEMTTKFVLGVEPLSSFDTFIATVRRMGLERAVEIQNAALTRYNRR